MPLNKCPVCHGKGKDPCESCHGSGSNSNYVPPSDEDKPGAYDCKACHGTGDSKKKCQRCNGTGIVN